MRSKGLVVAVVLGGAFMVFAFCTYALWTNNDYSRGARDLPNQLRMAKTDGLALQPADLKRSPPLDPAKNAADVIRALANEIHSRKEVVADLTSILGKPADEAKNMPKAAASLRFCTHLFELTAEAAKRPDCDFDRDYSLGPALLLPEYADIKAAVKALSARAQIQTNRGQYAEAWQSLEEATVLARHSGQDPCLIGVLVRIACDAIVSVNAQRIMVRQHGSPVAVDGMRRVVKAFGPLPDLHGAFRGELVMGRVAVDWLRRKRDLKAIFGDLRTELRNPLAYSATACDSYDARLIEAYRRLTNALTSDVDKWHTTAATLQRIVDDETPSARPSYAINAMMLPVLDQAVQAIALDVARRRLCFAGAEVFAYKNAHGRFPDSLPVVGQDGVDVMDGKPLRYRPGASSFLLYSVGRNLVDDGGRQYEIKKNASNTLDEVFGHGPW